MALAQPTGSDLLLNVCGEVEKSLKRAQDAGIPLFVVGVGTLGGGRLPEFKDKEGKVLMKPSEGMSDDDIKAIVKHLRSFKK